jgi:hypothetical protein
MKQANPKVTFDKDILADFVKQHVLAAYLAGYIYGKHSETLASDEAPVFVEDALDSVDRGLIEQIQLVTAFASAALQEKGYDGADITAVLQGLV